MSLADRVAQWPDQWRQEGRREGILEGRQEGILEGRQEGIIEGRQEGIQRERALLRRLAELRFGASVAERVEVMLANVDDWDQLAQAGEFIFRAQTSTELMAGWQWRLGRQTESPPAGSSSRGEGPSN